MDSTNPPPARISVSRGGPRGEVTITDLNEEEGKKIEGVMRGHWWARFVEGRLEFAPAHEPAPAPIEDAMLPQWRTPERDERNPERYQAEMFELPVKWQKQSQSILIQHLCGYSYTPEGYKENAELLAECGFACMRSPRGDSGLFWEIWFLPGLWAAKGRLKEALYGKSDVHKMRFAIRFLRQWTSWGTLDLTVQRYCQVLD
jgi:hypothetical protein